MKHILSSCLTLGGFVLFTLAAAAAGSAFTSQSIPGWYATLHRPTWTPPNWVFGPVWMLLYLTMAVAAWLVWREHGWAAAARPLAFYGAQLLLNVTWSVLFFGLRKPSFAFIEILILWIAILITLVLFWRTRFAAGLLLLPYLFWTTFAAALNYAFWRLNP